MGERWDRDRFMFERARDQGRFDDDRFSRGGRGRDHSDERYDRRPARSFDDDDVVRDRRYYGEEPRYMPQREREREMPPFARRGVLEKERERERDYFPRRESPPRRPGFLRRQSSLDTFDRRPANRFFQEREEYPPPARREDVRRATRDDYRAPPYTPIPLPKSRGLPPPRRFADQGFYDDIKVAEPDYYGDEDFRPYPERIREKEYTRSRRARSRGRSRDSRSTRTRSVRSSSYTSDSSSRSSSSSGGTTVRSEYPKKGKTRIPAKLVSKRALIDLGYPFFEEGNTIIVQKALGQDNIDELLKVSEDYKKVEAEIAASRQPKAPPAALPAPPAQKQPAEAPQQQPPAQKAPPAQAPPTQAYPPTQQAPPQQAPPAQAPPKQAPPAQDYPVQLPPQQAPPQQMPPH
ncbi:component of actin cortical patches LAS17, partial [Fusarium albosuccineum]